ncbi:NUDIX domain-containing protein [bacterium]|nr:NUDIX domain-containing protein [bacterium]
MSEFPIVGRVPLEEYRRLMENFPVVTVDVLFFNPDRTKILLGKRTNEPYAGKFYSFGGRLYKNEDLVQAACRIAKEELGLDRTASDLVFSGIINEINPASIFDGVNYHTVDVYFACTLADEKADADSQHSEMQWFSIDDPSLHPNVKARIEGALRALK